MNHRIYNAKIFAFEILNHKWIKKHRETLINHAMIGGDEEWRGTIYGIHKYLSDTKENEREILLTSELMNSDDWELFYHHHHRNAAEQTIKYFPKRLKNKNIWRKKVSEKQIEPLEQTLSQLCYDTAWNLSDYLHYHTGIKPSWTEKSQYYKERKIKLLHGTKDPWWNDNPQIKDTESRVIYKKLETTKAISKNNLDELYTRLINGHYLRINENHDTAYEYDSDNNEYYGIPENDIEPWDQQLEYPITITRF